MALVDPNKVKVVHVLKDGTVLDSIDGYVPRFDEPELKALAQIFISVSQKRAKRKREEKRLKEDMRDE